MTVVVARIVRDADLVRKPWKNGGGTTAEIAAFPDGADLEAVGWRISLADVGLDGPFSVFAGLDRTLTLVEGAGITLEVDGVRHHLDADRPSFSFPGEARTIGWLPAGAIRDLNVMTRRDAFTHRVRVAGPGRCTVGPQTATLAVVALAGRLRAAIEGNDCELGRLDCWLVQLAGGPHDLVLHDGAVVIEIGPADASANHQG